MKYPLISVVIPARNEERYLPRALKALRRQDYPNFELIVVDNASQDKTASIARAKADKVIYEAEVGLISARQTGFAQARGEIVARTDADTIVPSKWLSQIYQVFKRHPDAVAVTGPSGFYDAGPILKFLSKLIIYSHIYLTRVIMGHYQLSGPNFAVKKAVLEKTRPHLDEGVLEDMDLSCHVACYGKVVFLPSLFVPTSSRRVRSKPLSLLNYGYRSIKSILLHHPSHRLHNVR